MSAFNKIKQSFRALLKCALCEAGVSVSRGQNMRRKNSSLYISKVGLISYLCKVSTKVQLYLPFYEQTDIIFSNF